MSDLSTQALTNAFSALSASYSSSSATHRTSQTHQPAKSAAEKSPTFSRFSHLQSAPDADGFPQPAVVAFSKMHFANAHSSSAPPASFGALARAVTERLSSAPALSSKQVKVIAHQGVVPAHEIALGCLTPLPEVDQPAECSASKPQKPAKDRAAKPSVISRFSHLMSAASLDDPQPSPVFTTFSQAKAPPRPSTQSVVFGALARTAIARLSSTAVANSDPKVASLGSDAQELDGDSDDEKDCMALVKMGRFQHLHEVPAAVASSSRASLKPCGMISFPEAGQPEATEMDIYLRAPKEHLVAEHFDKGRIGRVAEASLSVCTKKGLPANQGKYIGMLLYHRLEIQGANRRIGFAVFMNGINVSDVDFHKYTCKVHELVGRRIPALGIYNASNGFLPDSARLLLENYTPLITESIRVMRYFLSTAAAHLYMERISIGSTTPFLMIVHSEGGLILYKALKNLDSRIRDFVIRHMYVITLGAVHPIPNKFGVDVINIYSKKDHITNPFADKFRGRDGYRIKDVCCSSDADDRILKLIDHSFLAATYQKHLAGRIEALEGIVGFAS